MAKYRASPKGKAARDAYQKRYRTGESHGRYLAKNKERLSAYLKAYHRKYKFAAMSGYSEDGVPRCNCCGVEPIEFLTIDHVNNDGNVKRRELGGKEHGVLLHKRIVDSGWPAEYQVLCFNCNLAKGFFGACPHTRVQ